jgi:hypothetical protein
MNQLNQFFTTCILGIFILLTLWCIAKFRDYGKD